ncbi:AraC family transcriptional regulator [Colwellia sp. 20A7]|uniref:AraC family transcriptional regulator n=1 Tax=Colwellia sp. 20A7 TaxID=2689569 RepID=UPI001357CCE3|nr:AraC family transcriptional regulator [Colwellia sp. 20A7]
MKTFDRDDDVILCRQFVVALVDLAKQSGIHPDKVLKGTQCFYSDLTMSNALISTKEFLTIIDNAVKLTKRDDLSFILGRKYFPSQLGALSQALLNCKNIAHMIKLCQLFQFQLFPFLFFTLIKSRKNNEIKTHLLLNSAIGSLTESQERFLYEFVLSAITGALKYRFGKAIPVTIRLPYETVEHIEQYHVNIGSKPYFNQPLAMLSIYDKWLYHSIDNCSSSLKKLAIAEVKNNEKNKLHIGFTQAVCQFINSNLAHNACKPYDATKDISLQTCAKYFAVSPATLKRKLAQHHTNFQQLLDKMRRQHAVFAIIENQQSNECIASSLKFNDIPNFRRAFKRWTGLTPSAFRENEQYSLLT